MLSRLIALAWLLSALFTLAPDSTAQGGYAKEKYPEHGLTFDLARDYAWLAIQPTEEWIVLQWVFQERGKRSSEKTSTRSSPKLQIARIDYVADQGPTTPDERNPEADTDPEEEVAEKEEPVRHLNSWPRYLERRLSRWDAKEIGKGKERDGFVPTEYELRIKKGSSATVGWAYVWDQLQERTFIVMGWCKQGDFDKQVGIWRKTAEKMRFSEPVPNPDVVKWERFYARRSKFKDPEYRIRVRKSLDGNWEAEDTENYIIISNTKDQPLVRRIVKDMESIRKEYVKLFPPAGEIKAVSTVRICENRDEYFQYGGPTGSAGYWNWVTEELVLYDGTKREKGKKTDKVDTFIVLYHEAFHQYIHYSAGKLSPHSWFNEGYGDFFSGAQVKGGKVKRIGSNRWRVGRIKHAVEVREFTPWKEIIHYEQPQYYERSKVGTNYAQGWSMVYFLNTSKKVQKNELWSQVLTVYFETLKSSWAEGLGELEAEGKDEDRQQRGAAQLKARQAAVEAAFEGIDIDALEAEWILFVNGLEEIR